MVLGRKLWGVLAKARHIKQFRPEASLFLFFWETVTFGPLFCPKNTKNTGKLVTFLHLHFHSGPSDIYYYICTYVSGRTLGGVWPRGHTSLWTDILSQKVTEPLRKWQTSRKLTELTKTDKNWQKLRKKWFFGGTWRKHRKHKKSDSFWQILTVLGGGYLPRTTAKSLVQVKL